MKLSKKIMFVDVILVNFTIPPACTILGLFLLILFRKSKKSQNPESYVPQVSSYTVVRLKEAINERLLQYM